MCEFEHDARDNRASLWGDITFTWLTLYVSILGLHEPACLAIWCAYGCYLRTRP